MAVTIKAVITKAKAAMVLIFSMVLDFKLVTAQGFAPWPLCGKPQARGDFADLKNDCFRLGPSLSLQLAKISLLRSYAPPERWAIGSAS